MSLLSAPPPQPPRQAVHVFRLLSRFLISSFLPQKAGFADSRILGRAGGFLPHVQRALLAFGLSRMDEDSDSLPVNTHTHTHRHVTNKHRRDSRANFARCQDFIEILVVLRLYHSAPSLQDVLPFSNTFLLLTNPLHPDLSIPGFARAPTLPEQAGKAIIWTTRPHLSGHPHVKQKHRGRMQETLCNPAISLEAANRASAVRWQQRRACRRRAGRHPMMRATSKTVIRARSAEPA